MGQSGKSQDSVTVQLLSIIESMAILIGCVTPQGYEGSLLKVTSKNGKTSSVSRQI